MKPIKVNKNLLDKYSIAPYNFVSLPAKTVSRYKSFKDLPAHDSFKDKSGNRLLSGSIEYSIEAKTPIIVSRGKDESGNNKFFRDLSGEYAIPGSTIRGMVKTNSSILSFSDIVGEKNKNGKYEHSEIENSRFLYRDIASNNVLSKQYKEVLGIKGQDAIARNLKVGYIRREGKKYFIYKSIDTKTENPYFKINERRLRNIAKGVKGIQYMYLDNWTKSTNGEKRFNTPRKNDDFKPYQVKISFNYDEKKRITAIGNPEEYKNKGHLLTGRHIGGKMSHYIIPDEDKDIPKIQVPELSIEAYIDDMIRTKKAENKDGNINVKPEYEFYELPKDGEIKPVFFIELSSEFHFGFTPYLRVMYTKSVLDGLPKSYYSEGISYTDSMFGFINKLDPKAKENKLSYKSRISFEDAKVICDGIIDSESSIEVLLAEPKPTSFNLYLKQRLDSNKSNFNIYENNFTIRGVKQYWLKDYIEDYQVEKGKMTSRIFPLKENTQFKGRIQFKNLNEDELGLLLWSLKVDKDSYENIGLAKPLGFGRVEIKDINLKIEDIDKKYSSFSFDYTVDGDIDKYIGIYKKDFSNKYLKGNNIEQEKTIKELKEIKTRIVKKEDSKFYRYMNMQDKEFKEKKVLPEILNYENAVNSIIENKPKSNKINKSNNKTNINNKNKKPQNKSRDNKSFGNTLDLSAWGKK